jgi:flagellar basal-body rod protein FlgC
MFNAIDTSATGVRMGRAWMETTSDNIANVNTVRPAGEEPYRAKQIVATSLPGTQGVQVDGYVTDQGAPEQTYDPDNPLADKEGYVTRPKVDLTNEMTSLLMAQRLYQANLSVMTQARDSYEAAIKLGQKQ